MVPLRLEPLSTSEPVWDTSGGKFGPFAGQAFVGELTNSLVMRACLEEVNGRMQGACFEFRRGFQCGVNRLAFAPDGSLFVAETNRGWGSVGGQPHGLQRIRYTGHLPFEMHSLNITPTGWTVRFTKPIDLQKAADPATYFLDSYTYHYHATYGSPEIERKQNEITAIDVASDGLSVHLTVPAAREAPRLPPAAQGPRGPGRLAPAARRRLVHHERRAAVIFTASGGSQTSGGFALDRRPGR